MIFATVSLGVFVLVVIAASVGFFVGSKLGYAGGFAQGFTIGAAAKSIFHINSDDPKEIAAKLKEMMENDRVRKRLKQHLDKTSGS